MVQWGNSNVACIDCNVAMNFLIDQHCKTQAKYLVLGRKEFSATVCGLVSDQSGEWQ